MESLKLLKKLLLIICLFCNLLYANSYEKGMIEYKNGNEKKSLELFRQFCDNGPGIFCVGLGDMFAKGKKVTQNLIYAKEFYSQGCKKNNLDGCLNESFIYFKESKIEKALEISKNACKKGHSYSCYFTALFYKEKKDNRQYFSFLQKAYEMKNFQAYYKLGIIYAEGLLNIVEKNYNKSFELFNESCFKGNIKISCVMRSSFYEKGIVVKKDLYKSESILKDMCNKKFEFACIQLNKLNTKYKLNTNKEYLQSKEKFINEQIYRGYTEDVSTNLIWQDNDATKKLKFNRNDAKKYCEKLRLGGFNDWRLPYEKELMSLVNTSIMQNLKKTIYWTITSYFGRNEKVGVDFNSKPIKKIYINKQSLHLVRCVRKIK